MRETVVLTGTEQQKLVVLNRVLVGDLTAAEAATALERSVRQVRRMLAAYRKEGAAALAHGNRGRTPGHALAPAQVARVVVLAQTTYAGLNDTHLSEVLAEEEGIVLSRASVRRVRMDAGLPRPRQRRPPAHRRRRERKAQAGMLLQLDGSRHAWLEERGPWLTLIAAIDDATGTVPVALFREQEDAAGYLALLLQVVRSVGVPEAVYHDRHGIFLRVSNSSDRQSRGPAVRDRGDGPIACPRPARHAARLAPPKTRNCEIKPAPTGGGIDSPPKVTKLGRETGRPEVSCADWVNARLSGGSRAEL